MAGGKFSKLSGKERPGTYINFVTTKHDTLGISERGYMILPLTNHNYGPVGEFIELTTESPDGKPEMLGYSIYDNDANRQMLLIREAFKRASTVYVYRINGGTKARASQDGITATAKYPGTRGNALTYAILQNPVEDFDVEIFLDGSRVAFLEGISTVEEMNNNKYIDFTGSYTISAGTQVTRHRYVEEIDAADDGSPASNGYYEEDATAEDGYKLTEDTEAVDGKSYYSREAYVETVTNETAGEGLPLTAGVNLAGATDTAMTNMDVTAFMDKWEAIHFNTVAFPITSASLQSAAKTKIKYIRESIGKGVQVVMPSTSAGDYEGVINVTNSVAWLETEVVDGKSIEKRVELTTEEACAWVAAATAAATNVQSNTYVEYEGASEVVNPKSHEQAVAAIKNGEFFFSMSEGGSVIVEYDINTLVSYGKGTNKDKDKSYRKNRVIRVFDTFAEAIQLNFPPNKYDNSPDGWAIMEGVGRSILKQFADAGAIDDVDYDNDFLVDRSLSQGDETFFDVGLKAVDSAEKLYFTISTR